MRLNAATLSVILLTAGTAWAHDSWLIVGSSAIAAPGEVRMAFVTSEHFPVSEHATQPDRVESWQVHHRGEVRAVSGYAIAGNELAATVPLGAPGVHVLAVALQPRFIEIEADRFQSYLRSEGAAAALEQREKSGQSRTAGREYYSKSSKTFVEVGGQESPDFGAATGHTLEIIPLSNPCRWVRAGAAEVRVVYKGQSIAGVQVCAGHEPIAAGADTSSGQGTPAPSGEGNAQRAAEPETKPAAVDGHHYAECRTTGPDGTVRFDLPHEGLWFLRTHRIEPIPAPHSPEFTERADWRSHWASITFRVLPVTDP